jgi:hypothetical protein
MAPMASYREMDAVGRDPSRVRVIAKGLLLIPNYQWTEWELEFLERMATQTPERLSTRQAEVLFELRDNAELHSDIRGIGVRNLIGKAHEGRVDLDEGDDEWIVGIWKSGVSSLRRRDLGRLRRCFIQLGELEPHM